ncbi:type II toxin-antitoxin system MqsA family antitoxin [Rhizobium pusense]|uniref:Uncharacterized protein n=1 Tax=Agrobacterium genomosp. 2 str. CFBP 5494 TaxID=1183436 RepID=A0A9W5F7G6_9HYPH|nr:MULTISPECIES: type II toxin-antitoxin system MqsA family antitoxin [Agrobacterium]MDH0913093.1 type II toxin-antitoxin system MqsA family antitoxin [Agrobacterium pusense]MDH1099354.1 type II toxin-antitoxin system MqsA family antitoxin [Agrobacterium pusense]MDH1115925.1 type II toxin-antitoxin system MqsA family antitoxin [Agrobacterium pusense]MDH2197636.1 type II toxin-antitoxin system MqsA family antitoxin [Agrobacterium pusense]CUX01474.1 hypothetical protein AGR2A_pa10032 [Agrobacter
MFSTKSCRCWYPLTNHDPARATETEPVAAGGILKVDEKAFDKYERGLVEPSGPTSQLLRLLDRHPELVDELRRTSLVV